MPPLQIWTIWQNSLMSIAPSACSPCSRRLEIATWLLYGEGTFPISFAIFFNYSSKLSHDAPFSVLKHYLFLARFSVSCCQRRHSRLLSRRWRHARRRSYSSRSSSEMNSAKLFYKCFKVVTIALLSSYHSCPHHQCHAVNSSEQ